MEVYIGYAPERKGTFRAVLVRAHECDVRVYVSCQWTCLGKCASMSRGYAFGVRERRLVCEQRACACVVCVHSVLVVSVEWRYKAVTSRFASFCACVAGGSVRLCIVGVRCGLGRVSLSVSTLVSRLDRLV